MPEIVHFMSRQQIHALAEVFAQPSMKSGSLMWELPAWWYALMDSATK
jgi:hypothetical protein